jgi:hypothetical protein
MAGQPAASQAIQKVQWDFYFIFLIPFSDSILRLLAVFHMS